MRINKLAATARDIPDPRDTNWVPPTGAELLRHIYLRKNSAQQKDYTVRVVRFSYQNPTSPYSTRWCFVTMVYWGGSVDAYGTRTPPSSRRHQVKMVYRDVTNANDPSTRRSIETSVDLVRSEKSDYRTVSDQSYYSSPVRADSVSILDNGQGQGVTDTSGSMSTPTAPVRPQTVPSTVPSTGGQVQNRPTPNQPQSPPNPPKDNKPTDDEIAQEKWEKLKQKTITLIQKTIVMIEGKDEGAAAIFDDVIKFLTNPSSKGTKEYEAMTLPETLIELGKMFSAAVESGFLFFKVLACPQDLLDKFQLSDAAKQRIQNYLDAEHAPGRTVSPEVQPDVAPAPPKRRKLTL